MKIIYAEDTTEKYIAVSRAIKSMGYTVPVIKNNLEDAFDEILHARDNGEPFDIILTDMNYPEARGSEVTNGAGALLIKMLGENAINTPVILISSINYNIPGAFSCVWYVESQNWEHELELAIKSAISQR